MMTRFGMKWLVTALLICAVCLCSFLPAMAEEQQSGAPVELMPCIGTSFKNLFDTLGGFSGGSTFAQHATAWSNGVYAYTTVERGTITGWPDNYTFMIFLTSSNYSLDGYRVGDAFQEGVSRALSEGWTMTGEESGDFEVKCIFEKTIGGADYTLELQSDYSKDAIEFVTVSAINTAELASARESAAALEAANPLGLGGYADGFVFRNGVTWNSTAEEIILSEETEYSFLYEAEGWKDIVYSYASGVWYRPSLRYEFLLSDTVNMILYRYSFAALSSEDEYANYLLTRLNAAYGASAEPDRERFDRLYALLESDEIRELLGNWSLDDGTYIALAETSSGDLYLLYFNEQALTHILETLEQ